MAGILDISHIFLYKTKKETILEQGRSREPKTKIYETLRIMLYGFTSFALQR